MSFAAFPLQLAIRVLAARSSQLAIRCFLSSAARPLQLGWYSLLPVLCGLPFVGVTSCMPAFLVLATVSSRSLTRMTFLAACPASCHSLLVSVACPAVSYFFLPRASSAAHPLHLAFRFFSCPPLAARLSLFQLPTPCSSPCAFSAAHPLQLATRFLSCPALQLAIGFFSRPHLAARHALFQLPSLCSSLFALSVAHPLLAAQPLQLAIRFFSCPPLAARHALFQLPTPCISPCALSAA